MRIFCVGRNYADHISELNNERPDQPVIFTKPDSALIKNNGDFYYPDFSNDVHFEVEVVLRISKQGKHIEEKFASKYYDSIALGVDFTARDLQSKLKDKKLPWDLAKGFDGSAPISEFIPLSDIKDLSRLNFSLTQNNLIKQEGNTELMLFSFDYIVSFISRYFTLKPGDLIFTGTPQGVGPVSKGDKLEGFVEGKKLLEINVK